MNKRFKPQYLPYNDDAHALVEALAVELGLPLKGITGAKHKTILAHHSYTSAGHTKADAFLSSVIRHHPH